METYTGSVLNSVIPKILDKSISEIYPEEDGGDLPPFAEDMIVWLDASQSETVDNPGGLISIWSDPRGNGFSVTQMNAADQFTHGVAQQNGLDVLSGSGDFMSTVLSPTINSDGITIFAVAKETLVNTTNALWDMYVVDGGNRGIAQTIRDFSSFSQGEISQYRDTTGTSGISASQASNGNVNDWNVCYSWRSVNQARGYINTNAGPLLNLTNFQTRNFTNFNIGKTDLSAIGPLFGFFAEIRVFNRVLDAGELTIVHDDLKAKWAVP